MNESLELWVNYLGYLEGWTQAYADQDDHGDGTDKAFAAILKHTIKEIPLVEAYIKTLKAGAKTVKKS